MYQTVTIRIAAGSQEHTALEAMGRLTGRVRAIDQVPRHRAGATRAVVRPRRLHDDAPVQAVSSTGLKPAHACILAPCGAGVIADAGVSRASPRRIARAGALPLWLSSGISSACPCPYLLIVHPLQYSLPLVAAASAAGSICLSLFFEAR
jgi:hypothetical protein